MSAGPSLASRRVRAARAGRAGGGHDVGARRVGPRTVLAPAAIQNVLLDLVAPLGLTLGDPLRSKYGVTVVGIKRPGEDFTYATAETVVQKCDVIVVTGKTHAVETFAELG
ncbi:TrkA C-terminal domain-containing protein [Streptomyces canus]|uniref:TrkA C-terminal domain-containing protein n=1 Tax=Streptomyces canus TaxID=58343 RepID=UPI0036EC311E